VVHDLKEGMLGRWSNEPGAALGIFPDGSHITVEALAGGGGPECRIGLASLPRRSGIERRIQEYDRETGTTNGHVCDGESFHRRI
jgi:hypothetical protein